MIAPGENIQLLRHLNPLAIAEIQSMNVEETTAYLRPCMILNLSSQSFKTHK